jgi:hypothetical protein
MRAMKKSKNLFFILVIACAIMFQICGALAESYAPLLRVSAKDVYLTAGEENRIEVSLRDVGSFAVYEVKVSLSVPATTPGISIISDGQVIFNKIEEGTTKVFYPVIYVDRMTPLGAYSLNLQLSYVRIGEPQLVTTTEQIGIVVDKVSVPRLGLDIGMKALRISAGAEAAGKVEVENIGSEPVHELEVRLASTSPQLVVLAGSKFTHGDLEPDAVVTFNATFAVSRYAPIGVYTVTASASYEDADGRKYVETFPLAVSVDSVLVAPQTTVVMRDYSTTPETIHPGSVVNLQVELECLGARAYDMKAILTLDPLTGVSTLTPSLVSLGGMEPGERMVVGYRLIFDGGLVSGQYQAALTLTYLDVDGVPKSLSERVTMRVSGIISFSLINLDPVVAEAGDVTDFEADLLLIGTESVRFVAIELDEDTVFGKTAESGEYIGAVDPDSPIPFDLKFEVTKDASPGGHTAGIRVAYTDDLNQEHEQTVELPVTVVEATTSTTPSQGGAGGFWLWLRRLLGLTP